MIHKLFQDLRKAGMNKDEEKQLAYYLNTYVDYFNHVVRMNIESSRSKEWTPVIEYMFKQMDEQRRDFHNICLNSSLEINNLCDKYKISRFCNFDPEDREKVADFIGKVLISSYDEELSKNKSFDEYVDQHTHSEQYLNHKDEKAWGA